MIDINIGAITEALNDKQDRNQRNTDTISGADAVIEFQRPTADNGYTWYRKYASGWIEQGGRAYTTSNTEYTITFIKEMADTNYFFTRTSAVNGTNATGAANCTGSYNPNSRGTTSIKVYGEQYSAWSEWEVKGMAA